MPAKEKEIAIYIGVFDGSDNTFTWKKTDTFKSMKSAYAAFKNLCKKVFAYSYEDLMEVYNSPRLDVELREGSKMIKWAGVYEKEYVFEEE